MDNRINRETVLRSGKGVGFEFYRGERLVLASHLTWERIGLCLTTLLLVFTFRAWPTTQAETDPSVSVSSIYTPPVTTPKLHAREVIETPVAEIDWKPDDHAYVLRFQKVAMAEMDKYGIPASITLAQGLLESGAGKSTLARKSNNHFGIKCFSKSCSKGHCTNHSDDHHKDFFRIYPSAWSSYRAHSEFLSGKDRYAGLFKLDEQDYKGWAKGLSRAGYATDPEYAEKLVDIIELYRLHRLDKGLKVK